MKTKKPKAQRGTVRIAEARELFANYLSTEGCGCCQSDGHKANQDALAKLLRIPRYSDNSGNDYRKFCTK